jgi:hypothetical protein
MSQQNNIDIRLEEKTGVREKNKQGKHKNRKRDDKSYAWKGFERIWNALLEILIPVRMLVFQSRSLRYPYS